MTARADESRRQEVMPDVPDSNSQLPCERSSGSAMTPGPNPGARSGEDEKAERLLDVRYLWNMPDEEFDELVQRIAQALREKGEAERHKGLQEASVRLDSVYGDKLEERYDAGWNAALEKAAAKVDDICDEDWIEQLDDQGVCPHYTIAKDIRALIAREKEAK